MNKETTIFLMPIWVSISCNQPDGAIKELNTLLCNALEDIVRDVSENNSAEIDVEWSITKRIKI